MAMPIIGLLEVVSAHPLRVPHLLRAGGKAELLTPPQHEDVVQLVLPPPAAALSLVQDPGNMNVKCKMGLHFEEYPIVYLCLLVQLIKFNDAYWKYSTVHKNTRKR